MRAKLVLVDIENKVGDKLMDRIMRTYFQKYKFKHPTTGDFQRVVEQVTKAKWTDYFSQYVYSNRTADISVEAIEVKKMEQDGEIGYESNVLIQRNGGLTGPLPILLRFADGSTLTKEWSDAETHVQYTEVSSSPLQSVTVDPDQTNVLDNKLINNFMLAELPAESRTRWNLAATKLIEGILGAISW
jgi:aminopeptidase N